MSRLIRSPLFWILLVATGLRLAGLGWGLPASDGWDDDGFAPRNFLTALALTWTPGAHFTYPPLQALLLAIPALPVAGWALAHAPSLSQHDVIGTIIQSPYMTYFAVLGRLANLVMSLGIIWTIGEMTRLIAGGRAAVLAALALTLNFGLTYYGQVSNLDVPYLFWGCLSLLSCMRAILVHEIRRFWHGALFAAAAVATKDQAYALFLLTVPFLLVLWWVNDDWPRQHTRQIMRTLTLAAVTSLILLLVIDGAVTNASGFIQRLAFLRGPASQDYAEYLQGPSGWLALLTDMGAYFSQGGGILAMALAILGVAASMVNSRGTLRVAGLVPLLAIISFTACFNFVALRSDDRFLLPQAVLACVYIGIAADKLAFASRSWILLLGRGVILATALVSLHHVIAIDAAFLFDPRYDAELWMAGHLKPGDVIETYGQNCFLPRFPKYANVIRIGQNDLKIRNPLPGVTEIRQPFLAPRRSHYIVLSAAWARRYLELPTPKAGGRVYSRLQRADFANMDAQLFFKSLVNGTQHYKMVFAAHPANPWPIVHIHDSLNEPIWVFERTS